MHANLKQELAREAASRALKVRSELKISMADLGNIAKTNLEKIKNRWQEKAGGLKLFDDGYPRREQFPRRFSIEVRPIEREETPDTRVAQLYFEGQPFGAPLTDNSVEQDGYRHHDVFHLAFLAKLGWSPVLRGRAFFNCKRRSRRDVDEVQDGGRAAVIEEAISALMFAEGKKVAFYEMIRTVEYSVLRLIRDLTSHLEVSVVTLKQWEVAILAGFDLWREVNDKREGWIRVDLERGSISFAPRRRRATSRTTSRVPRSSASDT